MKLILSLAALLALAGVPSDIAGCGAAEARLFCCKKCKKSKACGDTCIAKDRNCTKPPGCACDV